MLQPGLPKHVTALIDPFLRKPLVPPRSLTGTNRDDLTKMHSVQNSDDKSLPAMAVRFNRALRDKRLVRPGEGRWVEYTFPDFQRVYVEANMRYPLRGTIPDEAVTARVILRGAALEHTSDLYTLMMMGKMSFTGDLLDVIRTADVVGLNVPDPETRKPANLQFKKVAFEPLSIAAAAKILAGSLATAGIVAGAWQARRQAKRKKSVKFLSKTELAGVAVVPGGLLYPVGKAVGYRAAKTLKLNKV